MATMDRLTYTAGPIPRSVRAAAGDAAAQCGYDQSEEVLLDYEIIGIRRVSARSVKDHYPTWLQPPNPLSPREIVRVDWQTWAVSRSYPIACKRGVTVRAESIIVAVPTLLTGEVFTYGLGPEYNWLEWGQGVPSAGEPGPSAFDALYDLITMEWLHDVCCDADGNPRYLDEMHPDLRVAMAKAIENCDSCGSNS